MIKLSQESIAQEALVSLGLSLGEAKTYLALATFGNYEATPLAEKAGVPQSKIYQYLNSLENKFQIVTKLEIKGKPNQYHAEPFEVVIEELKNNLEHNLRIATEYVQLRQKEVDTDNPANFLKVTQGERAIRSGLEELITKSDAKNFVALGVNSVISEITKHFENSSAEFLTITDILDPLPPIFYLFQQSEITQMLEELKVLILIEDVDFDKKTSRSFNIIGYPSKEMEIDPIFVQIHHPVIRNFQIKILLILLETAKSMNPGNILNRMNANNQID